VSASSGGRRTARRALVVGAGINGLVAANTLRRGGAQVLQLEKKPKPGGACTVEWLPFEDGRTYPIPTGASVFGMMQDFVFRDTGLAERIRTYRSPRPKMVYFGEERTPLFLHTAPEAYAEEARAKWGETGDVVGYARDLSRVREFLLGGIRDARAPRWDEAVTVLGQALAERWIRGSAEALFAHYFTADRTKIFESQPVTEAGPVGLDEPGSAFNVAVMATGTVLDGHWGFVNGGLWRLPLALAEINREIGVDLRLGADVLSIDPDRGTVRFRVDGTETESRFDAVFFATDPVTAARLTGERSLVESVEKKRYLGSSGKMVLVFREPVRWKDHPPEPELDATVRYFYVPTTWDAFRRSNEAVRRGESEYSPCHFQVYVEGAAMRQMGWSEPFDYLAVFFKDMSLGGKGAERPEIHADVERRLLARIANPEAFVGSRLFTPRDLQETFFFPAGNIDHLELCDGQNFLARTFSERPDESFYQFGATTNAYYCGAGAYPSGSVAGTVGSMAARQWLARD
jgi:phytoene dehydrogenase-like protein